MRTLRKPISRAFRRNHCELDQFRRGRSDLTVRIPRVATMPTNHRPIAATSGARDGPRPRTIRTLPGELPLTQIEEGPPRGRSISGTVRSGQPAEPPGSSFLHRAWWTLLELEKMVLLAVLLRCCWREDPQTPGQTESRSKQSLVCV
ncbi:hypothetical protein HPB47_007831 [Ixodes persulcatus]|uniref:Uncharacterized protein n=1 Tax=Ixodes persulcatus TaxID=34615 RepID=A0AC60P6T0_IXOPE|nr:hypothetical protein HPB47_007831 [Ixodes persulcatus]